MSKEELIKAALCGQTCTPSDLRGIEKLLACLTEISASGTVDLGPIVAELQALCDKLLTLTENTDEVEACLDSLKESIQLLCDKLENIDMNTDGIEACLEEIKTALTEVCDKLETGNETLESILECLTELKGLIESVCQKLDELNLTATAIAENTSETAANTEQLCEKLDSVNESLEAICEKIEALPTEFPADCEVTTACNENAGVYEHTIKCFEDGEEVSEVVEPTDIPCTEPAPVNCDAEFVKNSTTGFWDIVVICTDAEGNEVSQTTTQSDYECPPEPPKEAVSRCIQVFDECGLDNTFTHFADSNQTISFTNSDGTTSQIGPLGPFTGFTDQINAWGAALAAAFPHLPQVETFCTNGCGGLPAPVVTVPKMKFRYVGFRACPGDVVPIEATYNSDQREGVKLDIGCVRTEPLRLDRCKNFDTGEVVYYNEDCEVVEPVCCYDVGEEIPETPLPSCESSEPLAVCEWQYPDPQDGGDSILITPSVFLQFITCGSEVTTQAYTLDPEGSPVPHELATGNYYGNCDTGLPIEEPVPPCPEDAVFQPVELGGSYFILDNSNWDGAPTNHITNGFNFEFTFTYDDGSTAVVQQTADPLFANMLGEFAAGLGCTVVSVCANHTSANGCNAGAVANLANYPAYDAPTFPADVQNNLSNPDRDELWATGWLIDCDDCDKKVTRVEITKSNDAAYIGAFKKPTVYDKVPEVVFRAVTCDGIFWKDCEGNDIEGPANPCCVKPVGAGPELPIEECCLVADPSDVNRWCQNFKREFPFGNGSADTTYTYEIGGASAPVPNPHTEAEAIAALESLVPDAGWVFDENGVLCRTDGPGGVVFKSVTCRDLQKGIGLQSPTQSFIEGAEPECKDYVRTWGKFEEPIADTLAVSSAKLCELAETITECPNACAESATRLTIGRPAPGTYSYGGVTGASIQEFEENWEAQGGKAYITNQNGTGDGTGSIEAHWICPAIEGEEVLFNGEPLEQPLTISPNPMAGELGCLPEKVLNTKLCAETIAALTEGSEDPTLTTCPAGAGGETGTTTHQIQDNQTDFSWGYNGTTLKLQGQNPLNSPDAQPAFDSIITCIEDGGTAKITFTNPDGVQGYFEATSVVQGAVGDTTGAFSGIGDVAQLQSGKVATMVVVCCGVEGEEAPAAKRVVGCFDEEILSKLCQIEGNTTPKQRIQVLPVCDRLIDGSLVNIFIKYTFVQCQPVLTELFTDVQLTEVYNNNEPAGELVDCATGEPIEEPPALPLESNHVIEGCVEVDGEIVSAYTIVNQDGKPLFEPRPLSDLGFVDCCPKVEVPE